MDPTTSVSLPSNLVGSDMEGGPGVHIDPTSIDGNETEVVGSTSDLVGVPPEVKGHVQCIRMMVVRWKDKIH